MPADRSPRAQMLALAQRLLDADAGPSSEPVTVIVVRQGSRIEFVSQPGELDGTAAIAEGLSPLERSILSVATSQPQSAKKLATKLRRSTNSHFRDQLRNLCRRGLLVHGPDGYRLPE